MINAQHVQNHLVYPAMAGSNVSVRRSTLAEATTAKIITNPTACVFVRNIGGKFESPPYLDLA